MISDYSIDNSDDLSRAEVTVPQKSKVEVLESQDVDTADADIVVPGFQVKSDIKPKKQQNSDMGSDCAYFSGPENDDEVLDDENETFNFNLEDEKKP